MTVELSIITGRLPLVPHFQIQIQLQLILLIMQTVPLILVAVLNITLTATASGNTVNYYGTSDITIVKVNFYNLTISGSGKKTMTNSAGAGGSVTINHNLIVSGGTLAYVSTGTGGNPFTISGTTDVTGTLTFTTTNIGTTATFTGAVTINNGGTISTDKSIPYTFSSDVTIYSGGTLTELAAGSPAIGFAGNFANSGTYNANSGGVHTFSGTSKNLNGTISIPKITFSGSYTNNGTLTATTALAQSGTGTLTNEATGTLNINFTGTPGIGASYFTASSIGNTVNYGYGGTQTIISVPYYNLTLSTSGAKTFSAATTITGTLTINSGVTASLGTFTTHTAAALSFITTPQANGAWGSTASTCADADKKNSTYFGTSGTGCLTVGCIPPTTQATSFSTNNINGLSMNYAFTRGNGTGGVMVVAKSGSAPTDPVSGTAYTANPIYGTTGTECGGGFVVYNGTAAGTGNATGNIAITGLSTSTTYYFNVYEYNSTGTCYNITELASSATTLAPGIWTGVTSTTWNLGTNWSDGNIPTSGVNVTIPTTPIGGNWPHVMDGGMQCGSLTIQTSAYLYIDAGAYGLSIFGNISNAGTISNSSAYFNGLTMSGSHGLSGAGAWTSTNAGLTIEGGTCTLGSNVTVSSIWTHDPAGAGTGTLAVGSWTLTTGNVYNSGNITVGSGTINVSGDWTHYSTYTPVSFTPGTGKIKFNGGSIQVIYDSPTFYNLEIANTSGGVSLYSPVTVSNALTFTSGILTTTSTNILSITNNSTAAVVTPTTAKFVSGPMRWTLATGSAYTFPVGKGGTYYPFALTPTGTSGMIVQVEAFNTDCGGTAAPAFSPLSATEYWLTSVVSGTYTSGVVGLTRQIAIGSMNAIGRSPDNTTAYTNIGGGISGTAILNSSATALGYFAMGVGTLDHFDISTIASPQTVGTAITGITLTAHDVNNNTVTSFGSTVTYSGSAGITGTSASFTTGQLTGVSVTPITIGSNMTFVVTGSGKTGTATFNVNPGAATKFVITGSPTQTAGATQNLTITAQDAYGNTATSYTGSKNLTFSGANSSSNPVTAPTVKNSSGTAIAFGSTTAITFSSGVATVSSGNNGVMALYKVESATISATDGSISSSGSDRLSVTVSAGTATKFVITGSPTQTAGATQNLTITAQDAYGNTALTYTGDKSLTFSGANSSSDPATAPKVTDKSGSAITFGTATTITFTSGVATVSGSNNGVMTLYKAETAYIVATESAITTTGADRLTVTVSEASMNKFAFSLTSPQTNGAAFTGTNTLTAQDAYGNTVTTFSASANNVTIAANSPLTGAVSGLPGANKLTGSGDFSSGVANLTSLGMIYTGNAATGTFTATSATGSYTGTSGSVTINTGTMTKLIVTLPGETFTAGTGNSGTVTAQTAGISFNISKLTATDANFNIVTSYSGTKTIVYTGPGGSPTYTTSVSFTSGQSTTTLATTLTKAETTNITAKEGTSYGNASSNLVVGVGDMTKLVVTLPGQTFTAGTGASGTVTAQTAGASFNIVSITATDVGFNIITGYSGAKTISYTGPTGSPTYTTSVSFTNGVSTTTLATTLTKAENTTITATESSSYGFASSSLLVNPGTATKLGMKTEPTDPASNGAVFATQPAVYIQDQYGNTVTTSSASVTATVGAGAWTIGGTTNPQTASSGLATFSALTATRTGGAVSGFTITFTSPSLTPVTSAAFNIPVGTYYTRVATGNWNENATWSTVACGGAAATAFPMDGDNVYICTANVITVNVNSACASLTVNAPGSANGISISSGITLTVSGAVTMIASAGTSSSEIAVGTGVLTAGSISLGGGSSTGYTNITVSTGTINVSGSITYIASSAKGRLTYTGAGILNFTTTTGTLGSGGLFTAYTTSPYSTVNYQGTTQDIGPYAYGNLNLSGSGAKTGAVASVSGNFTLSGSTSYTTGAALTISGNLDIGNGTTFTVGAYIMTVTGATTVGGGTSGTLAFSSATNPAKTFTGLVTINNGAIWDESTNDITPTFSNGITNSGTFTASNGVHTFSTNSQTLTGIFSIPKVSIPTSGTILTNTNTLTIGTNLAAGSSGTETIKNYQASSILNIGGTFSNSTWLSIDGSVSGNTVNYTGSSQTIKGGGTYYHLILSGSGTKSISGTPTVVNGDITLNDNVSLDMGASSTPYTLEFKGNLNNSGSGTINFNSGTTSGADITISGGANQNIAGFSLIHGKVIINKTAGTTATFKGNVSGYWLYITSGTLNFDDGGTGLTHIFNGGITYNGLDISGGILNCSKSSLELSSHSGFTGGSFNRGTGTVEYKMSYGTQNIANFPYNNLTLSSTSPSYKSFLGATTISGTLTIGTNVKADLSTYSHTANALYFPTGSQAIGKWGSTSSTCPSVNKNDTYFDVYDEYIGGFPSHLATGCINIATQPTGVDHFDISAISSPQTACSAINGITITAHDASNNTVTSFTYMVEYSGTAGVTGTSAAFTAGVLTGVSVTPTVAGSSLTLVVTGSGKTGTATFDVNPGAATPNTPTSNSPQCADVGVVTLTANGSAPGGETWYWQDVNATGTSTSYPATSTYNATSTGTYYIRSQNNSTLCWSAAASVAVTINALPTISSHPSTGTQTLCINATPTDLSVTAAAGSGTISSYKWYSSPNSNGSSSTLVATHSSSATTDTYSPVTSAEVNLYYYVVVTNSNTCSLTSNVSGLITVNALPDVPTGSAAQTLCTGATVANLAATGAIGATFQWYAASTGGSPKLSTEALVTATDYWATQIVSGCESATRFKVTATINAPATDISGLSAGDYVWSGNTSINCATVSNWLTYNGSNFFTTNDLPISTNNVFFYAQCSSNPAKISSTTSYKNVTIISSLTIDVASILNVSGNWTNNGTFNGGGTVIFNGAANQLIEGANSTTFGNLTLNNANGAKLGINTTVNSVLTLSSGALDLNQKTLIINNTSTGAITRGGGNGYILSESEDSKVQWNITDNGTYSYLFGTIDADYIPFIASVTAAATGNSLTVSTWHTDNSNHPYPTGVTNMNNSENQENSAKCVDRFWVPVYSGGYTANFTFTYDASSVTNDLNSLTESKFVAQYWSNSQGGHWNPAFYGSQTAHNVYSVPGQSAPWVLVDKDFPLPIELLDFSASCKNNLVIINWSTSSETNNDYFTLERSVDAQDWVIVAKINGMGNSNTLTNYSFTDTNSFISTVYYRLKQTDFDGKFTYSGVVYTGCDNPPVENIQVFPNPAYDYLTCNILSNENTAINISITDVMGQSVISNKFDMIKGKNSYSIDVSKLAPATYYFKIETLDGLFKGDKLIFIR